MGKALLRHRESTAIARMALRRASARRETARCSVDAEAAGKEAKTVHGCVGRSASNASDTEHGVFQDGYQNWLCYCVAPPLSSTATPLLSENTRASVYVCWHPDYRSGLFLPLFDDNGK